MNTYADTAKNDPFTTAESFRASRWLVSHVSPFFLRSSFILTSAFSLLLSLLWLVIRMTPAGLSIPAWSLPVIKSGTFIALLCFLITGGLYSFYLFFRLTIPQKGEATTYAWERISYPAADILLFMKEHQDPLLGFLDSQFGRNVCLRSGVDLDDVRLSAEQEIEVSSVFDKIDDIFADESIVTLSVITNALLMADDRFNEAMLSFGVTEEQVGRAAKWVERTDRQWRIQARFWAPERLHDITPLVQDFTYGKAYTLEKFSRKTMEKTVFLGSSSTESAFRNDIDSSFNILSRPRDANLLLVGQAAGGIGDIILSIKSHLRTNNVPEALKDRKLYILDTQALIAAANESKGQFEYLLTKLLTEATLAGNVLLVIEDFVQFRLAANQLSANLVGILDRYLSHPDLPIIVTSSPADYHQHLEGREIMSSFGAVIVHDVDSDTLLNLLGEVAVAQEGNAISTIGALETTARHARNLITDDEMPHAAIDLFLEILSAHPEGFVDKQAVDSYVSQKTGVPTGEITQDERAALSNLETELGSRVIGQEQAVQAVAAALRRNRAGVEEQDRPIGTFLFLGPTGVGKTETAKTLNKVYFNESGLRRLDMSEYSQSGSIDDLRGKTGHSGRLANMVREKPYGVLLLDEFEKAHRQVHDLFLQILDEGNFTDGNGRRVSFGNLIIIATSNAGAQQIFSYVESGDDLTDRQTDIIDSLISDGEFRPELINRFDATVLYRPLRQKDLIKITEILLNELRERIKQQGYQLEIDSSVSTYLVESGYNPEFGARAIRRVIQDTVENVIADKIIDEGLTAGDEIELMVSDIKSRKNKS